MLVGGLVAGQGAGRRPHADRDRRGPPRWPATSRASSSGGAWAAPSSSSTARGSQITEERLEQVEGFFDRHGGKAILIGRFVGLVRAIAPFLAGSSRDAAAALPALRRPRRGPLGLDVRPARATSSGRASASSSTTPRRARSRWARSSSLVVAIVWLVPLAARGGATARGCAMAAIARRERPGAAAAGARARGRCVRTTRRPARFVWNRVTPGDLGLELTTLLAVAGVGSFAFVVGPRRRRAARPARGRPACRCAWPTTSHADAGGERREGRDGAGLAAGGRSRWSRWPASRSCWQRSGSASRSRSSSASRSPTPPCTSPRTPSTAPGRRDPLVDVARRERIPPATPRTP